MTELIHWAKIIAKNFEKQEQRCIISTGITPSGQIHIGNMREVLTADLIYKAITKLNKKDYNKEVLFYYFADTYDPLRKVYPFLNENIYREHVGKPLSKIPCPCLKHKNYSEHYLEPFLNSMKMLGINPIVLRTDELYEQGFFNDVIFQALENKEKIMQILHKTSGKEIYKNWSPFNPLCQRCGKINMSTVISYDLQKKTVDYKCSCGYFGTTSVSGGGKLTWRVEWPAKWKLLDITIEPFGKDHASSGGSYDTGVKIIEDIFKKKPPIPIKYEWILLEDKGAMSSSTGVVVSVNDMLEVVPPEVLRYLIARTKPEKHIRFDPGLPLLNLIDEYEKMRNNKDKNEYEKYLFELCQIENDSIFELPIGYRQMVTIYQASNNDIKTVKSILDKYSIKIKEEVLKKIIDLIKTWLAKYAPSSIKFGILEKILPNTLSLTYYQKVFLKTLALYIKNNDIRHSEQIQKFIYETTKKDDTKLYNTFESEIKDYVEKYKFERKIEIENIKYAFEAIYISLLGTKMGPKIGWFLLSIDRNFLLNRLLEASELTDNYK